MTQLVGTATSERGDSRDADLVERYVLVALAVLIGMHVDLRDGLMLGPALALALAPVWWSRVRGVRWFPTLVALAVVAAVAGVLLTSAYAAEGTSRLLVQQRTCLLLSLVGGVGGLLWARQRIGTATMAVWFGIGMVAGIPFNMSDNANQWRFTYSVPVIVLLLAAVSAYRGPGRVLLQTGSALALALVGLLNDSRSNSAMLVLGALAIAWHSVDHVLRRGRGGVYLLGVWGVCCFFIVQSAVLSGTFGESIQERTQAQIDLSGGNVLLGGRPEIAASVALLTHRPWGMGSGSLATYDTVVRAKTGMASIGYDPNNGYVERFMFGSGIEVHSEIGDYWLWFGPAGLLLLVLCAVVTFRGVQRLYDQAALTVLAAYLATRVAWDLFFSPAASSLLLLTLALALFLAPSPGSPPRAGSGSGQVTPPGGLLVEQPGARPTPDRQEDRP